MIGGLRFMQWRYLCKFNDENWCNSMWRPFYITPTRLYNTRIPNASIFYTPSRTQSIQEIAESLHWFIGEMSIILQEKSKMNDRQREGWTQFERASDEVWQDKSKVCKCLLDKIFKKKFVVNNFFYSFFFSHLKNWGRKIGHEIW